MKQEEFVQQIKDSKIVDDKNVFARVNIIYSETGQVLNAIFISTYAAQGYPGVLGVFNDYFVLYEIGGFSGKLKTEIFRENIKNIEFVSYKNPFLHLSRILKIKINDKKYKLVTQGKYRNVMDDIVSMLRNQKESIDER